MNAAYKLIAITGSIGSGKSTASQYFRELGAEVIDADDLAREVVAPGNPANQKIFERFGADFFDNDRKLIRSKMAEFVFKNPESKVQLEDIIHPEVRALLVEKLKRVSSQTRIVIYSVPLLFEARIDLSAFYKTILISATKKICYERAVTRPGMTAQLFEQIWNSQIPPEIKEKKVDIVIKNNFSLAELKQQVQNCYQQLI